MRARYAVGLSIMLLLSACSESKKTDEEQSTMPVSDTVFGPAVSTLDKARSVEGTLQEDKDKTDAAIGAAEK